MKQIGTPRVTYVLTQLTSTGASTQVLELCKQVEELGWTPSVVSLLAPAGSTERLDQLGVDWSHLGIPRAAPWSPRLVTGLRRALVRLAPTVVHSHTLPANVAARAVRSLVGFPVLVNSAHSDREGGFLRMLMYRMTDRFADLTTSSSEAGVLRYVDRKAAPEGRIRYVPNGIDTDRFAPDAERRAATREALGLGDAFTFVAIGRFAEHKDWPNLLDAATFALRPNDRLLVAGEGELRETMEAAIARRGLRDRVRIVDARANVADLLAAADAYVSSSAWDGLPVELVEAASAGLPLVATRVGAHARVVLPEVTGWLVPPRAPDELADAMIAVRELPAPARERMGGRARRHVVERYSMSAIARQWVGIYDDLLAGLATRPDAVRRWQAKVVQGERWPTSGSSCSQIPG